MVWMILVLSLNSFLLAFYYFLVVLRIVFIIIDT